MKKEELYELRGRYLEYDNSRSLMEKLLDIFDDYKFPLISGHEWSESCSDQFSGWKLNYLKPKSKSDELTVKNFLEGLNEVTKEFHDKYVGNFKFVKYFNAYLHIDGVERRNGQFCGHKVLSTGFYESGNNYNLDIIFSKEKDTARLTDFKYEAKVNTKVPKVKEVMDRYLGPNIE